MIEEVISVTVSRTELSTLDDACSVLHWADAQPDELGIYATVSRQVGGSLFVEVGGRVIPSVQAAQGDTITWDGSRFSVIKAPPPPVVEEPVIEESEVEPTVVLETGEEV